jgi:hypothetical protein
MCRRTKRSFFVSLLRLCRKIGRKSDALLITLRRMREGRIIIRFYETCKENFIFPAFLRTSLAHWCNGKVLDFFSELRPTSNLSRVPGSSWQGFYSFRQCYQSNARTVATLNYTANVCVVKSVLIVCS